MAFEPPDDSFDDEQPLDYDEELDGVSVGDTGGTPTGPLVVSATVVLAMLGLFLGPTLYRLAFGDALGEPCHSGGECRSGTCLQPSTGGLMGGSGEGICTEQCYQQSDCPSDLRCLGGNCAPMPTADLGDNCSAPWHCREGKCMVTRKNSDPLGGPSLPGLETYEKTGICKSRKEIKEMRETRRRLRKTREKLERMQRQLGQ